MAVQTESRRAPAPTVAGRTPRAPAARARQPAASGTAVARGRPGEAAGPLGAVLARSVAARAGARSRADRGPLVQRVLSFRRQREREALPKKYIEVAVADFEKLRTAVAAMRGTADAQSPNVAAWLNGELDRVSAFIASRDDKPVAFDERNEVVADIEEHARRLAAARKALPGKVAEDLETRRTDELGRADTIEARIGTSESAIPGLEGFLSDSELEAILAKAGTARSALASARGQLGDAPELATAGGHLAGAESDATGIEGVLAAAAKRQNFATRRAAVETARDALKAPRPRERIGERLLLLTELSPEQQIASLTDTSIAGGIAELEGELAAAQDVDASLVVCADASRKLRKNALFATWAKTEFPRLKELSWKELVISNGDSAADPGLKRLRKGIEHARLAVPRLKVIGAAIDTLRLDPLKAHLHAMRRKVAASWTEQVADLAALEAALTFAQDVEQRREEAVAALPGLTHATQRLNIEGWLRENEALTFAEQRDGVSTDRRKGGLKNIEARIAMYNTAYADKRKAAVKAQADRLAQIEAVRIRKAAEQAATTRLLMASDPSAVLLDLHAKAQISRGAITETYKSSYDGGLGEFSAEVRIGGLKDIVIHAHCAPDGRAKPGNAVHWKELRYKHLTGPTYSHPVPDALRPHLLDATRMKSNRDANSKINWR